VFVSVSVSLYFERAYNMPTTIEQAAAAATETEKKKRTRKFYRLGVTIGLKEFSPIPEGGLEGVPADWDVGQHKELRADDFADVLDYYRWVSSYGESLIAAAKTKVTELEAYGDADTRREMTEILGNVESVTRSIASTMSKEGMTPEQRELMDEQVRSILAKVLG